MGLKFGKKVWLAAFLAASATGFCWPDSAAGIWTPEAVSKIKSVSQVAISPDGLYMALTVSVPRKPGVDPDGPAWRELHVIHRQTGVIRPFVTGHVNVGDLSWMPDGKGIAFLAKRGEDKETSLYIIPADGGEARKALSMHAGIQSYSVSPDGKKVAVVAAQKMEKEIGELKEKGFSQKVVEEDWVPNLLYIAAPFSEEKPAMMNLPGSAVQVAWSPAGDRLAVTLAPDSLVDARYMRQKIHIIDAQSGEIVRKIGHEGKMGEMAWRPDGKMLAFIGAQDLHDPAAGRLYVGDPADGSFRDLLPGHQTHVSGMAWQSNDHIMFVEDVGVWTRFAKIAHDGDGYKELVKPGGAILHSVSLSRDGQHAAFAADTPRHPKEVYTMSHGDTGPRRLSNVNPWLDDFPFAPQEEIRFKARDGLDLEGIVLGAGTGMNEPLVVYVHGGPEAHEQNGWQTSYSRPGQVAAARGMKVLHLNYRGSTGRGVAFSKLSQGDHAGKEFDDLIDGVDHLIGLGWVDKDKVAITGGSYGGYATAWGATYYSHRFAAGVMFVGISNTISKVGTTDIPEEEFLVHALERPWDDWQGYLERSPIYHADKNRTPLLILHGDSDPRVNVGQSRELYRHIKLRGKAPVRLVLYPGEKHGNRRAASRFDYHLRAIRWLEHYLLGPGGDPPPYEVDYGLNKPE